MTVASVQREREAVNTVGGRAANGTLCVCARWSDFCVYFLCNTVIHAPLVLFYLSVTQSKRAYLQYLPHTGKSSSLSGATGGKTKQ